MTAQQFDNLLAFHCAPVLAGVKSANLISIKQESSDNLDQVLWVYNKSLNRFGIRAEILCRYRTHTLVLVYQTELLWKKISLQENMSFLQGKGYCDWSSVDAVLLDLKQRCRNYCVPHEIGLFLDYPLEDVIGFMEGGVDCKLCGYWKVYSDVEFAQKRFQEFTLCRENFCRLEKNGGSVLQYFNL